MIIIIVGILIFTAMIIPILICMKYEERQRLLDRECVGKLIVTDNDKMIEPEVYLHITTSFEEIMDKKEVILKVVHKQI